MHPKLKSALQWIRNIALSAALLVATPLVVFSVQAALRETRTRAELAPAAGHFVTAGDVELYYQELGPADGPVVVFIHGAVAWSELWRETMTPLAQAGYRCLAFDIPPFGFSERPPSNAYGRADQARRIVAALDALHIQRVSLVGHSFGGGATVETALLIPDRVQALVLADVGALGLQPTPPPSWLLQAFFNARPLRNAVLASTVTNPLLSQTLLQVLINDPADATPERVQILQFPGALQNSTDTLGDWVFYNLTTNEASLSSDPARYQTLTAPVRVIWGEVDTTIPLAEGEYVSSLFPHSELIVMPRVNHIPHIEEPEQFQKLVLEFLEQTAPAR